MSALINMGMGQINTNETIIREHVPEEESDYELERFMLRDAVRVKH